MQLRVSVSHCAQCGSRGSAARWVLRCQGGERLARSPRVFRDAFAHERERTCATRPMKRLTSSASTSARTPSRPREGGVCCGTLLVNYTLPCGPTELRSQLAASNNDDSGRAADDDSGRAADAKLKSSWQLCCLAARSDGGAPCAIAHGRRAPIRRRCAAERGRLQWPAASRGGEGRADARDQDGTRRATAAAAVARSGRERAPPQAGGVGTRMGRGARARCPLGAGACM